MLLHARWDNAAEKFKFKFPWTRFKAALGSYLRLLLATARGDEKSAFRQSHGLMYDIAAIEQAIFLSWKQALRKRLPS